MYQLNNFISIIFNLTVEGKLVYTPDDTTDLQAGKSRIQVYFTPENTIKYDEICKYVDVNVQKRTPVVKFLSNLIYLYAHERFEESHLLYNTSYSSVSGHFEADPELGAVFLEPKQFPLHVQFHPEDQVNFASLTFPDFLLEVLPQEIPNIYWEILQRITYGELISADFFSAKAFSNLHPSEMLHGEIAYNFKVGDKLTAGIQSLELSFTPYNTIKYSCTIVQKLLIVDKYRPRIKWPKPNFMYIRQKLSEVQLCAYCDDGISGSFKYQSFSGYSFQDPGVYHLEVQFIPDDINNYSVEKESVTITIHSLVDPQIIWDFPENVTHGTLLSLEEHLNAYAVSRKTSPPIRVAGDMRYTAMTQRLVVDKLFVGKRVRVRELDVAQILRFQNGSHEPFEGYKAVCLGWPVRYNKYIGKYGRILEIMKDNDSVQIEMEGDRETLVVRPDIVTKPTKTKEYRINLEPGRKIAVGEYTVSINFTPDQLDVYCPVEKTVVIRVSKIPVSIVWPTPADIFVGDQLFSTQLNASVLEGKEVKGSGPPSNPLTASPYYYPILY